MHIADKLFQLRKQSIQVKQSQEDFVKNKIFVIVGGTSGIGFALSDKLRQLHAKVYAISRNSEISIDITDFNSVQNTLHYIYKKENKIDLL